MSNLKYLLVFVLLIMVVSTSAKDTRVNTSTALNSAISSATAGDTITILNGTYSSWTIAFNATGTNSSKILLRAQTTGGVILSGNSCLYIGGQYLVVDGLTFTNGYATTNSVIEFRTSGGVNSSYCRLTNTSILNYSYPDPAFDTKWLSIYGDHHRVDHCALTGKTNKGQTLVVWLEGTSVYHEIDSNYFGPRPDVGGNGGETIRVGTGTWLTTFAYCTVEYNLFDQCNGEMEMVSNKSSGNTYRYNTFRSCQGTITMRQGNFCSTYGNFILGNGISNTGGIRVFSEDHNIYNNYISGLKGNGLRSAITLGDGSTYSDAYIQVKRANVINNTLVGNLCNINVGGYSDTTMTLPPTDCVIANNLVSGTTATLCTLSTTPVNMTWQGNIFYGATTGLSPLPANNYTTNPNLASADANGIIHLSSSSSAAINKSLGTYSFVTTDIDGEARSGVSDIGADEYSTSSPTIKPLVAANVGPVAYPITANVGSYTWNTTAAWINGVIPGTTDKVIIPSGSTITLTASDTVSTLTINTGGTLIRSSSTVLTGTITNNGNIIIRNTITANTGSFNWNTTAAWVGSVIPSTTDDVIIPNGSTITLVANTTVNSTTINSGGTLIRNSSLTLSGTITNNGTIIVRSTITANTGSFTWSSASAWVGGVVPGTNDIVIIPSGSTITLTASTTVYSTTINSGGTLVRNSSATLGGTTTNNGTIIVSNTITANTGSFTWSTTAAWVGAVIPGTYDNVVIPSGSTITLTANTTVNSTTINSGGTLIRNSSIILSGTITNNGTIIVRSSFTANTGSFNWSSTSAWVGGVVPGINDYVIIPSGSTITLTVSTTVYSTTINSGGTLIRSSSVTLGGTVTNNGTITITNTITANTGSYSWTAVAAWVGGVVPGTNDDVIIPSGSTITLSTSTTVRSTTINSGGTLIRSSSITLGGTVTNNGSLIITSTINANTGSFTWNTTAAWVGGVVPGTYDDVIIPNGAIIRLTANTTVNSTTINTGGILVRNSSVTLSGTVTNNGSIIISSTITANTGSFTWNTTAAWVGAAIPGTYDDVIIPNGAILRLTANTTVNSTTINIGGTLVRSSSVTLSGAFTNNGSLVIASTITANTGSFTWSTTAAWVGAVIPGTYDDVIIPSGSIITLTANTTVNSTTINSGGILVRNSSAALNGTITNNGSIIISSTITANSGSFTWSSTSAWVGAVIPGTYDDVVIPSGATITLTVNTTVNSTTINSGGTLIRASSVTLGGTLTNNGTLIIRNTITANTGSFTWSSTSAWVGAVVPTTNDDVVIPSGAIIKLTANTTVNSTTINSGGILLRTAAITLSGTIINNGSIIITSTITANTGSFVWNTTAAWVGGVIPGTYDAVIIPSGSTVALTANDTVNSLTINSGGVLVKNSSLILGGIITNNGTLTSTTTITANVGTFNWNATAAWVGGVIPGASNDVVIPSGSFISTSTLASITVASTTINSGGSLTIGATITLNGNIFCYGTLTGGSFVITTNGNITVSGTSSGILFSSNSGGFVGTASRIFSLSDGASFDLSKTGATPITSVLSNSSGTWTWIVTNTPNNTTITYKNGSSSTVITALPNSQTYGNLGIKSTSGPSASWTNTLASSLTIAGNLIITNNAPTYRQTLDMLTYTITGNGSTSAVQVVNTNTGSIGLQTQTSTTDFTSIFPGFTPITASTFASYSFNYAGAQAIPGGSYSNLQISGTGAVRTLSGNASVSGTLTLTLGKLFLGNNNLTLGSASTLTVTPSSTTMIVTDGTGSVVKQISGVQSFTFPIGDNTGTAEYSPVTINVKSGSLSSASISARTANSKHSLNTNGAGYINRYWSLASSGITSASMDVTGTYLAADVSGTESSLFTAQYSGGKWNKLNAVNSSLHQITGTNLSSLGDFSASAASLFSTITLAVTFIPEGYYRSDTDPLPVSDNFTVTLASTTGPDYADVETEVLTLDSDTYTGTAVFTSAPSGNYYIYIKGMALMSTWSAAPLALTQGGNSSYDFTTGVEKAYSIPGFPFLPMILQGTKWCIYSGDIDQDELIGNVDLTMVDNDAFITLEVHGVTDLDGDSLVGNVDLTICDNHAFEVVESQSPRKTGSSASKYLHKSLKAQTKQ